jgi:catechol 2,3-dioxygenase-like lactoylglutathione lyase family enzyme
MEILSSRILLRPRDHAATRRFYREVLALPVYREFGADPGGVVFFLGGGFLEITGEAGAAGTDATQIWLQVRDVEAAAARLRGRGVALEEEPVDKPWGLREMRARDPDGRLLIFVEVPADHPLRRDPRS